MTLIKLKSSKSWNKFIIKNLNLEIICIYNCYGNYYAMRLKYLFGLNFELEITL